MRICDRLVLLRTGGDIKLLRPTSYNSEALAKARGLRRICITNWTYRPD